MITEEKAEYFKSNIEELKEEILNSLEQKIIDMVKDLILKDKKNISDNSSSEDSAYQAALELGSDFYGTHTSERAKHRNFRKCK